MNNENLVPHQFQSGNEARENGSRGGKASGESRRRKKAMREVLEQLLAMPNDENPERTNLEMVCIALLKKAESGDVAAIKTLRDTVDGQPTVRVESEYIDPSVYAEIDKLLGIGCDDEEVA